MNGQVARPQELDLLNSQYEALLEISEAISAHRDLNELFHDLAQRLPRTVPFDFINLVLHDPGREVMRLHALVAPESSTIRAGLEMPIDQSPAGLVWKSQQPLLIEVEDVAAESRFPKLIPLLRENEVKSYCVLPLTTALRRLGAMGFGSLRKKNYPKADFDFMQHVAKQVAVAVDNVLHDESAQSAQQQLTRERDRVRLLLEVNNAVVSHLDLDDLFTAVSACLRRVIQHDDSGLILYDQATRRYRVHLLHFAKNESLIEEGGVESDGCMKSPSAIAITTRKPAILGERDLRSLAAESQCAKYWIDEGVRILCSVPLLFHDRVLGALDIGRRREDPFNPEDVELLSEVAKQIAIAVENAKAYREITELKDRLAKEKLYLEEEVRTDHNFGEIVGESAALRRVLKEVETVAPAGLTVLIRGETGTGKELVARAIHDLSPRHDRTFVKLNCAAIPTGLLESELFGHEKGAFTGAIAQRIGRFELANGGTLFLDEVGDIPLELQPKLLRVLQEQEFERLGSAKTIRVDVRVVAATNADLTQKVADNEFRLDLYYRLNVFPLAIPPLRERREDIPLLVRYFVQKYARRMKKPIDTIPVKAMNALTEYHWPGNVRELENFIERAVILSRRSELEIPLGEFKERTRLVPHFPNAAGMLSTLEQAEREHILRALGETNWTIGGPAGAALKLGMKRTTLQSKMRKLGIGRPQ
ncbi:MAG TPA: sigma 54-interacting transcriptional regulator [Candidatus Binatia bacterium]|nr:sigma 54-interacting transcriptional regulator [Candidatus Binatia bacterium]